jgi:GNAT superfamily N-acetyltransferase
MVTVRKAEPRDAEGAVAVLCRSITELCALDHRGDPETIRRWLENKTPEAFHAWLASDDNFCVVAELQNEIVGVGLIHRSGDIRLCYLAPGLQRQGIGASIYWALEERAKVWGLDQVHLESTVGARKFYEHLGFRPAGPRTSGCGASHCYPYEKTLQPNPLRDPRCQKRASG